MPLAHAKYSPSSAKRVVSCPASFKLSQNIENQENEAAAEGTCAHHFAEQCMRHGIAPYTRLGKYLYYMGNGVISEDAMDQFDCLWQFEIDEEMVLHITNYIAHCLARPGRRYIEIRVDITPWCPIPDQFGTSDHIAIDIFGGTMYIDDLKYGRGVYVNPKKNLQAILYALGTIYWLQRKAPDALKKITRVVVGIYQPRIDNIDEWETTVEELLEVGKYIKERFALTLLDDPPFGPSDEACEFCPVHNCRARAQFNVDRMPNVDEKEVEDVASVFLDDKEMMDLWLAKPAFDKWFARIHAHLFKKVYDGDFTELRMVEGRGRRYYKDEAKARELLILNGVKNYLTKEKLISPAQAERVLNKQARDELQEFIGRDSGQPRLAPLGTKHRDYGATLIEGLDNLDDLPTLE